MNDDFDNDSFVLCADCPTPFTCGQDGSCAFDEDAVFGDYDEDVAFTRTLEDRL